MEKIAKSIGTSSFTPLAMLNIDGCPLESQMAQQAFKRPCVFRHSVEFCNDLMGVIS